MTTPPDQAIARWPTTTPNGLSTTLTDEYRPRRSRRLTVTGSIDLLNVDEFNRALEQACVGHKVLLDLTRAEFISSAAVSALFGHRGGLSRVLVAADSIVGVTLSAAGFPAIRIHAPGGPGHI